MKTQAGKLHDYRDAIVFEKLRFKLPPISVHGRPNRRNKNAFSNSSGVVDVDRACIAAV